MHAHPCHLAEIPDFDPQKIADSGQCFRMKPHDGGHVLVSGGRQLTVQASGEGRFAFSCSGEEFTSYWHSYFDLGASYASYRAAIPERDVFLTRAAEYGRGIRILRQEPFETLITFILSQRKNIPAIKQGVESLCRCFGEAKQGPAGAYYAFPSPEALAAQSLDALRSCSLGYRAPYVQAAARMVASGEVDLLALTKAPQAELMQALHTIPGVGEKVANCVSLFAFHRIEAFPVDVWIARVVEERYAGHFPLGRYKGFAGVIQQYLFYYARSEEAKALPPPRRKPARGKARPG